MLKVITSIDGCSWESLPSHYSPLFLLDKDIVGKKYVEEVNESASNNKAANDEREGVSQNISPESETVKANITEGNTLKRKQKSKSIFEKKRQLTLTLVNSISNDLYKLQESNEKEDILDEAIPILEKVLESLRASAPAPYPQATITKSINAVGPVAAPTSVKHFHVKKARNRF